MKKLIALKHNMYTLGDSLSYVFLPPYFQTGVVS